MAVLFGLASPRAGLADSLAGLAFDLSLASGFHVFFLRLLVLGSFSPPLLVFSLYFAGFSFLLLMRILFLI